MLSTYIMYIQFKYYRNTNLYHITKEQRKNSKINIAQHPIMEKNGSVYYKRIMCGRKKTNCVQCVNNIKNENLMAHQSILLHGYISANQRFILHY